MNKIVLAPLAALLFAVPVQAADFTGPRVEARFGWDKIGVDADADDGTDTLSGSGSADDIGYGVEGGYDVSVGRTAILGAYAGVDFSGNKVCTEVYGEDEACLKAGRNFTVGVRSGLTVGQQALVYVKGGYSNGKVSLRYEDFENIIDDFKVSETRSGFHVGAGAELAFGKNAYGKLEYVYTDYNGYDYDDGDIAAGIDSDRHQVVAAIGLRF